MRELTPGAQLERDEWETLGGCSCHISPPCHSCTHPGNPANQEEDESAWEPLSKGYACEIIEADQGEKFSIPFTEVRTGLELLDDHGNVLLRHEYTKEELAERAQKVVFLRGGGKSMLPAMQKVVNEAPRMEYTEDQRADMFVEAHEALAENREMDLSKLYRKWDWTPAVVFPPQIETVSEADFKTLHGIDTAVPGEDRTKVLQVSGEISFTQPHNEALMKLLREDTKKEWWMRADVGYPYFDPSMCAPSKEPPGPMRINQADKIRRRKARKAAKQAKRRNRK